MNIEALLAELSPRRPDLPEPRSLTRLKGETVLVTGAGGSIGSTVVTCLTEAGANVVATSRSELGLSRMPPDVATSIMDVTDQVRVANVLLAFHPSMVIHCAAHKHVPMLESNAGEAVKNNYFGTVKLIDSCILAGVDSLVVVSTDKAINPTSVMGATKRAAEQYAIWRSQHGIKINCVRFGNVLGSSGSVLGIFEQQAIDDKPITITHPDMDRYFMTAREAAMVAISAGLTFNYGSIFTTDLGAPVKIIDLANAVRAALLSSSQIVISGVRPGEKIHEEIDGDSVPYEGGLKRYPREQFSSASIRAVAAVLANVVNADNTVVRSALAACVPEYQTERMTSAA